MDGTMFDTERLFIDTWIELGQKTGWPITEEMLSESIGGPQGSLGRVLQKHFDGKFDFEAVRPVSREISERNHKERGVPVKPGLYELLDYLAANGYKTAVATSTHFEGVIKNFEAAGVSKYFHAIVSGDMVERGKPDPEIYLTACKKLGLRPEECLSIEDSTPGLLSACRAGLEVVMIPDIAKTDERLDEYTFAVLASLHDVGEYLERKQVL
jgi:HAD superfamily hydrolase (TIGR01509 family)